MLYDAESSLGVLHREGYAEAKCAHLHSHRQSPPAHHSGVSAERGGRGGAGGARARRGGRRVEAWAAVRCVCASGRTFLLSLNANERGVLPCATPPPLWCGALRVPCRALPVPFCGCGFFPVPLTSPRSFVFAVPCLAPARCHSTTRWRTSVRRGAEKRKGGRGTLSPVSAPLDRSHTGSEEGTTVGA